MSEHENIAALVVQTTQRFPNGVALEVDGGRTSYRDFVGLASVMAARLTHGTGASTSTAIWADRSVASYVGVLAALMRGHCYVPLNPALPRERLRAMLLRTSCRNLIYDARRGPDVETLLRDLPLAIDRVAFEVGATAPTDLPRVAAVEKDARAYVLFTSGSTGTPKGVPVTHANVRALLDFVRDRYAISPSDRCSQTFDLTFDLSVFDMFATWTAGACLAVPSHDDLKTPDAYIRERGLTVWFSVPSLAAFMDRAGTLTAAAFPSLRLSLFCGEALPCQLARKWSIAAPKSVVENTYGPTELTVFCTFGRWTQEQTPESCELGLVPIGKPLPGMRVRVCDDELHLVEPGHVGEVLMTGPQLTPGYLDDPEKTAAAYVKLPGEDAIYYRTGDRVRWKSDGEPMSFIGRRDGQIKVRGYRVELGEIENVLANYVGVSDVVVVAREGMAGEKRLIAYVVPVAGARPDVAQLRTFLAGKLPDYMVPSAFVSLDKLPLTPNGKVDRKALPAPHDRPELGTAYEAPRDETEALLAKMWSEVLRIDRVGVQDNFFGLGGDSLLAVDVLARVNDQFDLGITVAVLFENQTIRSFVTALKDPAVELPHWPTNVRSPKKSM